MVTVGKRPGSGSVGEGHDGDSGGDGRRQRGFFSTASDGPDLLESACNLTVQGYLLSVAGIVHTKLGGR